MAQESSGWYADPTRRHTYRYWGGTRWSNQVSDGGAAGIDPVDLDEQTATTPPAPGTQAPGMQSPTTGERPPASGVEVTQSSGGTGLAGILGVLVGVIIVVVILLILFNNSADDGTPSTDGPGVTVTEDPATTEAPATSAP